MPDLKPFATYQEQMEKLYQRGCSIVDKVFCKQVLENVGYYRFSAYFLPFRVENGNYIDGTSFHLIYRIYEFDRKMRSILFAAIEELEIYLRAKFSYYHASVYGNNGYTDSCNFSGRHNSKEFDEKIKKEIRANRKLPFVKHHLDDYGGAFPLWVIMELFTFGMLSYFFSDMKKKDQKILAKDCFSTIPKNVTSWLRCCTDLRNICAHYGRLYFRKFSAIPCGLGLTAENERSLFGCIQALKYLYPNTNKWNHEVLVSIEHLFSEYGGYISLEHIGFPENWEQELKKKNPPESNEALRGSFVYSLLCSCLTT